MMPKIEAVKNRHDVPLDHNLSELKRNGPKKRYEF
jgi:hypothetical protein